MSDSPSTSAAVDEQVVIKDQPLAVSAAESAAEQDQQQALRDLTPSEVASGMRVRVSSPFREYYDGIVSSLTAVNATGPFDILPRHHNFISLLLPCELIIRTLQQGDQKIRISGGIMHVKADQVIVFLDV
jgi:hypothetical protein